MSLLNDYESVATLTRKMLEAARSQDWDTLTSLGALREPLVVKLPTKLPPMSAQDGDQITRLIQEILACHAEIADRAGPWLEQTAQLIAAFDGIDSKVATTPTVLTL